VNTFFKKLLLLILIYNGSFGQDDCPPCEIIANPGLEITKSKSKWPELKKDGLIRINTLTNIYYEGEDIYWPLWKISNIYNTDWWTNENSDPWSLTTDWKKNYKKPDHNFKKCVNDELRWKCGYSYTLRLPKNFDDNKKYPLVVYLHGSVQESANSLTGRKWSLNNFYMSENDEYIIAAPTKLGIDWSPKKIQDLVQDVKGNIKIDANRIYLTGLSMGGRGTFIVASKLPNLFAAIMPLSPHHRPYSYLPLADKVDHIPTFIHHSTNDATSSFSLAKKMYRKLSETNENIVLDVKNWNHSGWHLIYRDKEKMEWLLSWKK